MKLLLKRIYKGLKYTIGKLYINGVYFCDTLEDPDRGLIFNMSLSEIEKIKVYGDTAIPTGTYPIVMNVISPKFKDRYWAKPYGGIVPRLKDGTVPGYLGVLIHVGNKPADTLGCILVGKNNVVGQVTESANTYYKLMDILLETKEDIEITIE